MTITILFSASNQWIQKWQESHWIAGCHVFFPQMAHGYAGGITNAIRF